jgi:tRNA isopentenyl-2-thiomethyl-A-37 hydroxylase MiaE
LGLLARGFARQGDAELAEFYTALATAEERHAEIFVELARPLLPEAEGDARIAELAEREAEILADLPHASRIH